VETGDVRRLGRLEPSDAEAGKKLNPPKIQLYDLSADISERKNVYKEHPEVVKRPAALLRKYVLDGRSTPGKPQPYYKQKNWPGLWWLNSTEF